MFTQNHFEIFSIDGLEARMAEIRSEIQPVFSEIGQKLLTKLSAKISNQEFYFHIAQHRRRTANAPENTWSAISTKARGYKMEAHFQLGIWEDYVFIYLSMIDQPKKQKEYAELLTNLSVEKMLTEDFIISKDHTKAEVFPLSAFSEAAERLGKVKKSELEIGRLWSKERFDGKEDSKILAEMLETIDQLLPIYQKLMEV
ncbi:hypothetical protein LACR_1918 [Lactococcus cremoris subsp. cremoris SK11]|uniref:UPF0637 protein LACR_1918 n=2 Tax=Lactococcus lactis subsp. cremoris TaxID=1359 RepID=Y1918_LACLS|nr:DUF1054 family protein [Lactococcus cremoris]Q02XC0.1 RecName: Full=UPF0637 protein LACR_1918 [Lactococcus cremoris subsp. cremoris SK11]ABJ73402.1 hypothetical protein LACR_1918 [Lactococcus cremoris subsp. cremoris SK11]ARE24017.1 DUF1054 family protein [Lactococcus cremoris]KZK45903.1 hypothetical protein SK110_1821 [Lactococcus cremoris]KZK53028.1 hypothetical protein AM2_1869 [Lactococcus cremoris]MCT4409709.1 DUF1054 family protein [Lactococcus cremoris]